MFNLNILGGIVMKNLLVVLLIIGSAAGVFFTGMIWQDQLNTTKEVAKFEAKADSVMLQGVYYVVPQVAIDSIRESVIKNANGKNAVEIEEEFVEFCAEEAGIYYKNILFDSIPGISEGNLIDRFQAVKKHLDKKYPSKK